MNYVWPKKVTGLDLNIVTFPPLNYFINDDLWSMSSNFIQPIFTSHNFILQVVTMGANKALDREWVVPDQRKLSSKLENLDKNIKFTLPLRWLFELVPL